MNLVYHDVSHTLCLHTIISITAALVVHDPKYGSLSERRKLLMIITTNGNRSTKIASFHVAGEVQPNTLFSSVMSAKGSVRWSLFGAFIFVRLVWRLCPRPVPNMKRASASNLALLNTTDTFAGASNLLSKNLTR